MPLAYCTAFDICLSAGDWFSTWLGMVGGLVGSASAVAGAYWLERSRERREQARVRNLLRASMDDLESSLAPYRPQEVRMVAELENHVPADVWRTIIAADRDLRWLLAFPLFAGSPIWRAAQGLSAVFERHHQLIELAADHLDTDGSLHNVPEFKKPAKTHWFACAAAQPLADLRALL